LCFSVVQVIDEAALLSEYSEADDPESAKTSKKKKKKSSDSSSVAPGDAEAFQLSFG